MSSVNHADFVRIWQTSNTGAEAAERAGVSRNQAAVRAHRLREKGVPLKKFVPRRSGLDVVALTKIALEAQGEACEL